MSLIKRVKELLGIIDNPPPEVTEGGKTNSQVEASLGDCKCIYCQREFWKNDFLGLCSSRDCAQVEGWKLNLQNNKFAKEFGPRQILLRNETKQVNPKAFESAPVENQLNGEAHLCPHCMRRIIFYACPHCRAPLMRKDIEQLDNMIAVAGIGGSGKSIYITVAIEYLINHPIDKPGLLVTSTFMDNRDTNNYMKFKHEKVFKQKKLLPSNKSGETPLPLLILTTVHDKIANIEKTAYAVWYDLPGEVYEHGSSYDYVMQDLAAAKGIILFVDPTNSPKLVDELKLSTIDNSETADKMRDMAVLIQLKSIFAASKGNENAIRGINIAVVVSKIDLLRGKPNCFPEDSQVWQPSAHFKSGGFSVYDYERVKEDVRDYLRNYHDSLYGNLQSFANADSSNIGYFGVSALGHPPKYIDGALSKEVEALRVEDPFYWLLWRMKLMPGIESIVPLILPVQTLPASPTILQLPAEGLAEPHADTNNGWL